MKQKKSESKNRSELRSPKHDPLGMYTGNPTDNGKPQQDADDL